ncbi:MAG TPA: hypothetical protein VKY26_10970 [Actinomycetota bacterium]|nr:hypothetical protein [Actinomycetota bacterium]
MSELIRERLYLKEPGTKRLRKGSAGQLRHLLATGWRETDRSYATNYVAVQLERESSGPEMVRPSIPVQRPPHQAPGRGPQRAR